MTFEGHLGSYKQFRCSYMKHDVRSQSRRLDAVFRFCYGLEACPLRKADLNVLDFVVNRFSMKLFRTNNIGMVKECQSYFSFQLPTEMLKQRTERFDMKFKSLPSSRL